MTRALVALSGVLIVAGIIRSAERQRVWRNDAFLAVRSVQDAPRSFRLQRIYGDVAFDVGQPDAGTAAFDAALALAPAEQRWRVHNDIARTYRRLGAVANEAEHLRASVAQRPEQEEARAYLIGAELTLGEYADAARQADSALARGSAPKVFSGLRRLADSAAKVGAPPGSVRIAISTGDVRRAP